MTIRTAEGRIVETLEHHGRNTPFRHREYVVLRVAVDGKPYPSWQIPGYVWADKKTKEQPVKEDDHGCDPMRYVVAERDFGIRVLYRSFTA